MGGELKMTKFFFVLKWSVQSLSGVECRSFPVAHMSQTLVTQDIGVVPQATQMRGCFC